MIYKNSRAYLYLETITAMTIFLITLSSTFVVVRSSKDLWERYHASICEEGLGRIRLGRDLRGATNVEVKGNGSQLSFELFGDEITYNLQPEPDRPGKYYLRKTINGIEDKRVANDISSLTFSIDSSGIHKRLRIDMTFEKSVLGGATILTSEKHILTLRNTIKSSN